MLEPIGQLLDGNPVRIEVAVMHHAQIARRVMIDDPARIELPDDRLCSQGQLGVVLRPRVARIGQPVDHGWIHVLVVTGGVVAHRIGDHGRMIAGDASIELGMAGVAVFLVGVGRFPVVMREVRLREGNQHSDVVGRSQDFREAQMRPRLAIVVVRIDKVDAEALEPEQTFPRRRVSGLCGADRGVVQRHG